MKIMTNDGDITVYPHSPVADISAVMTGFGIVLFLAAAILLPLCHAPLSDTVFALLFLLAITAVSFSVLYRHKRSLTLTDSGVLCRTATGKSFIRWQDIGEWGACVTRRRIGLQEDYSYIRVYFSHKEARKTRVYITVTDKDYEKLSVSVIPFIKSHTAPEPNINL